MQADFDDIRFSNQTDTALSYWIQDKTDSSSATVWVKVDSLAASSNTIINMYYASASSASESNGNSTFMFFDDFNSGSLDQSKWDELGGTGAFVVDGSKLIAGANSSWSRGLASDATFSRSDIAVEFKYKWTRNTSDYDALMFGWYDNTGNPGYTSLIYGYYNSGVGGNNSVLQFVYEDGSSRGNLVGNFWNFDQEYGVRVRMRQGGGAHYDYSQDNGLTWTTALTSGYSLESNLKIGIAPYSSTHAIDDIRVRKWTNSEPTSSFGAEAVKYPTSGNLTSNILDLGFGGDWGVLSYTTDKPSFTTVKVRTSNDPGMAGAPAFAGCAGIASGTDLTGQSCVTNNHRYVQYQVTLNVDSGTTPTLQDVSIQYDPWDTDPPDTNASNLSMKKSAGGSSVTSGGWTNGSSPYFEWDAGADNSGGSGIKGYCLYLGQDNTANPITTKGLLGTSPVNTEGACQFAVSTANVDLATSGYIQTALTSSNTPYYLNIKALDNAGNVFASSSAQFSFRFDNTPPANPAFISAPSQFVASKNVTLTWPTSGGDAASDANSGLDGLQYKIANTSWYGDSHSGSQDNTDLLANDGSYTTVSSPDYPNLVEGNNIVHFRTWDQAGNVSATSVTTVIKLNTSSPSSPQNLTASPASNTTNSFAFSWAAPSSFQGSASNLTYCYSVNTLPSNTSCTFTTAGVTNLPAGAYATQPGANTLYLVAKDEAGNINYATAASETFTANTAAPGIPLNIDIADVSIKTSSTWRLALSWNEPTDTGAGIASYRIERSTNGTNFSQVATTSGTSHVDGSLSSQKYYYRIKACDSANNCGANSAVVADTPTGKFTEPANITSQPVVIDVTSKKAKVKWSTDRTSDSKVSIGTKSGTYDPFQVSSDAQVTDHSVALNNLTAGTTYFAKVSWTDEDGNTGVSSEFSFKTQPAPSTQDISVLDVDLSSAKIRFTSVSAEKVVVQYGLSSGFGGFKEIATSLKTSTYEIELVGLEDGSKYIYRLNTFDADGNEYQGSTTLNFTTPARPRISNLAFQPVSGEPTSTQQVTWTTNVPTTSLVRFAPKDGVQKELSDSTLVTEHKVILRDLLDDTEYTLTAESRDAGGNLAVSDAQKLKTALDTRSPKVSNVKVETVIRGTGAEASGQIVVSWKTDEPATSQVAYGEGSGLTKFNNRTSEGATLATEHIVIISDLPTSRVFSVQPLSTDRSRNSGQGVTKSAIIGKASDSVITIVLNSLKGIFGF